MDTVTNGYPTEFPAQEQLRRYLQLDTRENSRKESQENRSVPQFEISRTESKGLCQDLSISCEILFENLCQDRHSHAYAGRDRRSDTRLFCLRVLHLCIPTDSQGRVVHFVSDGVVQLFSWAEVGRFLRDVEVEDLHGARVSCKKDLTADEEYVIIR